MSQHNDSQDETFLAQQLTMLAPLDHEQIELDEAWRGWQQLQQSVDQDQYEAITSLPAALEEALQATSAATPAPVTHSSPWQQLQQHWQQLLWWLSVGTAGAFGLLFLIKGNPIAVEPPTQPRSTLVHTAPAKQPKPLRRMAKGVALKLWYTGAALRFKAKARVQEGDALSPGDQIQLTYENNRPMYMVIASINEKGEVSILAPLDGKTSQRLDAGKGAFEVLELDDYIGQERLFALSALSSFSVTQAKASLKRAFAAAGGKLKQIQTIKGPWMVGWSLLIRKQPRSTKGAH